MPNLIGELASGIVVTEFDYITASGQSEKEVTNVSGWLGANIGQLNTLLYTTFSSGDLSKVAPSNPWKQEEKAIYTQQYLFDYYTKQGRIILRNFACFTACEGGSIMATGSDVKMTPWTTLREGDTTITREAIVTTAASKNEAARIFRLYGQEARSKIKELVYKYNFYQAQPRQVAGTDGASTSGGCY